MATLGTLSLTLADWAKRFDQDGKVAKIIEMLSLRNEILDDMTWMEGNLTTGNMTTVRAGLPTVTWRQLNYGVQPSKARTAQVTDTCGMLEALSIVDKKLADLGGQTGAFRASEDMAFLEAMNQAMATTLFYGNQATDPTKFTGLAPRYNTITPATAESADNVIDGGGSGATNTSVWLNVWGDTTMHGIFPKGSQAGLRTEDQGEETAYDANLGEYRAYKTRFMWDAGFTVRDWRYAVRVANIDVTTITKNASAGADLIDLMTQALERVRDLNMGTPVFYVNRTIKSFLRRQIVNKIAQSTLSWEMVGGKRVMMFGEVPVKRVDALLNTEAALT